MRAKITKKNYELVKMLVGNGISTSKAADIAGISKGTGYAIKASTSLEDYHAKNTARLVKYHNNKKSDDSQQVIAPVEGKPEEERTIKLDTFNSIIAVLKSIEYGQQIMLAILKGWDAKSKENPSALKRMWFQR
jgi:transposase